MSNEDFTSCCIQIKTVHQMTQYRSKIVLRENTSNTDNGAKKNYKAKTRKKN